MSSAFAIDERSLPAEPASVDGENLAVHIVGGVGSEEHCGSLQVCRLAPAAGGNSFEDLAIARVYGFLAGYGPQWAVECGAARGALAMTTPGDTTMASLADVERVMKGGTARVSR